MLSLFKKRQSDYPPEGMDLPLDENCYVVLDTELTGLDHTKDSVVSIGGLKMTGARINLGDSFYRVVKPRTSLTSESVVVHGITPSDVAEMPSIDSALSEFLEFCEGCVLVGHFLSLDLRFLNQELKRLSCTSIEKPVVDTQRIHEWIKKNNGSFSGHYEDNGNRDLFTIAKAYQIQVSGAHNALTDAFITAQVFQRLLSRLPKLGVKTLRDLLRIGRP